VEDIRESKVPVPPAGVKVKATIVNGKGIGQDYSETFTITFSGTFFRPAATITHPKIDITLAAGDYKTTLAPVINPSGADLNGKTIEWEKNETAGPVWPSGLAVDKDTGELTATDLLKADYDGKTFVVRARIAGYPAAGSNLDENFNVTFAKTSTPFYPVLATHLGQTTQITLGTGTDLAGSGTLTLLPTIAQNAAQVVNPTITTSSTAAISWVLKVNGVAVDASASSTAAIWRDSSGGKLTLTRAQADDLKDKTITITATVNKGMGDGLLDEGAPLKHFVREYPVTIVGNPFVPTKFSVNGGTAVGPTASATADEIVILGTATTINLNDYVKASPADASYKDIVWATTPTTGAVTNVTFTAAGVMTVAGAVSADTFTTTATVTHGAATRADGDAVLTVTFPLNVIQ